MNEPTPPRPPDAPGPTALADARAALARGAPDEALRTLLGLWRRRPLPELARLVDAVSSLVAREPVPPPATRRARHDAWLAVAAACDPCDLPRLLAALLQGASNGAMNARLAALARFAPDPRLTPALEHLLRTRPYTRSVMSPMWRSVFAIAGRQGDARLAPLIAAFEGPHEAWLPATLARGTQRARREALAAIARANDGAPPAPLAADERAAADALASDVRARAAAGDPRSAGDDARGRALLGAIAARFDDDAARMALADYWLERDEPRGRYVTLATQLARAAAEKLHLTDPPAWTKLARAVDRLREQHEHAWLGSDLREVIEPVSWARGLLYSARVRRGAAALDDDALARALADPAWLTLRELTGTSADPRVLARVAAPALARLGQPYDGAWLSRAEFAVVCARRDAFPSLAAVAVRWPADAPDRDGALAEERAAPCVPPRLARVELELRDDGDERALDAALAAPAIRACPRVALHLRGVAPDGASRNVFAPRLRPAIARVFDPQVEEVVWLSPIAHDRLRVRREPGGDAPVAALHALLSQDEARALAGAIAPPLREAGCRRLTVDRGGGGSAYYDMADALRRVLEPAGIDVVVEAVAY